MSPPAAGVAPTEAMVLAPSRALAPQEAAAENRSWFSEQLALAETFPINDQEDLELATEALKEVKERIKALIAIKKTATDPLTAGLNAVRSWFTPVEGLAAQTEAVWKTKILDSNRRRQEEATAAAQLVQASVKAGDRAAVTQAVAMIRPVQAVEGLQIRESWDYEIINQAMVPPQFLMVDDRAVKAEMKAHPEGAIIPGIKFFKAQSVAVRS